MPAMVIERQKLSRPMWDSLKRHILHERQRKKQEQEADAEVERQRREREDQQKEQEMTLEETKEQISQLESRLAQLKDDKHQLFLQLKKVLNEDETRRRIKESSSSDLLIYGYPHASALNMHPGHPQLYIPGIPPTSRPVYKGIKEEPLASLPAAAAPPSVYGPPMSVLTISPSPGQGQPQSIQKRSRSPSPPPQIYHSYKIAAAPSPYSSKSGNPYGPAPPGSVFYGHAASVSTAAPVHSSASTIAFHPPGSLPPAAYSYPPIHSSSHPSRSPYSAVKEEAPPSSKQHPSVYLGHPSAQIPPRGYGGPVPIEHLLGKSSMEQEKFYQSHPPTRSSPQPTALRPVTILSSAGLHPPGMPVQQSPQPKTGSITSGHPVRAPLPVSAFHSTASSGHGPAPRVVYSQPGSNGSGSMAQLPSRYYGNPNQRDN